MKWGGAQFSLKIRRMINNIYPKIIILSEVANTIVEKKN